MSGKRQRVPRKAEDVAKKKRLGVCARVETAVVLDKLSGANGYSWGT